MFSPVSITLSDGRRAELRTMTVGDAAGLLALERALLADGRGVVKYEDELPADVEAFATRREESGVLATDGSAFALVAIGEGGELVAEVTVVRLPFRMLRHVAVLEMGVHPTAQEVGLGRAVLEHMLGWVRSHSDPDGGRVSRVELYTLADNTRAIQLYRSVGFEVEGCRRNFVRRADGTFIDDLVMSLLSP